MSARQVKDAQPGDVVQITDQSHHWFPAFLVVTENKGWGVMGYMIVVTSNDPREPNGQAFIRIENGKFERIGQAVIVDRETA